VNGGVELELDTFLTTSVDGDAQPASCNRSCTLGEKPLVYLEQEGEGLPSWSGRSSERKVDGI
jgi:hypothetical protein